MKKNTKKNFQKLADLPANTFFRVVTGNGKISKKTYIKEKGCYNRSTKKYLVTDCNDIFGDGRELKGTQKVFTDFEY